MDFVKIYQAKTRQRWAKNGLEKCHICMQLKELTYVTRNLGI